MVRNYIKIAFRNLFNNKSHALINIGGLAVGVACAFVIFLIIQFDYSFDTYHENASRTYRLIYEERDNGETRYGPGVPYPLPEALKEEFPQIEHLTMVDANITPSVVLIDRETGRKKFSLQSLSAEFAHVNSDYFRIFDYTWLLGDPETALNRPGTLVISKPIASKLFGNENPIGKTITLHPYHEDEVEITGVVAELPENTNLPFNMLGYARIPEWAKSNWGSIASRTQCYFTVNGEEGREAVASGLDDFVDKYGIEDEGEEKIYRLQPLEELHFSTQYETYGRSTSKAGLLALGFVGLMLLITACINFINLNTAVAVKRSKEVGVRKVLGGTRGQLIGYFLLETALVTSLAVVIALILSDAILEHLNAYMDFGDGLTFLYNPGAWLFIGALLVGVTLLAGFYPSLVLSGFNPVEAIRNRINARYGRGLTLRRSLVVLQFAIAQVLIIATIVIWSQMRHLQTADMGFKREAIVEVPMPNPTDNAKSQFRDALEKSTSIQHISLTNTGAASSNIWSGDFVLYDEEIKEGHAQAKFIDEEFLETYGVKLISGDPLTETVEDTATQFLVNETLARKMGYGGDPAAIVGKEIRYWGNRATVVGVVEDFNTHSLYQEIQPVILMLEGQQVLAGIKIKPRQMKQALTEIREAWNESWPDYVFSYQFLDDKIARFYEDERKGAVLVSIFTLIAIFIGCLGLFALVSYMAATRSKEIAVRKVLGAEIADILAMFSKEFGRLIGMAFIVAAPIAYLLMSRWLNDFAYRIGLGAEIFLGALMATVIVAVVTIGIKSVRTAATNPVHNLKSE